MTHSTGLSRAALEIAPAAAVQHDGAATDAVVTAIVRRLREYIPASA